jgi:hypothetical protein
VEAAALLTILLHLGFPFPQGQMLAQHALKQAEHQHWYAAVQALLEERDQRARAAVADFERTKKRLRAALAVPGGDTHALVTPAKVRAGKRASAAEC